MRTEDWYPYGEKELLEQMKRLAAAYTPEWRMDTERPDVGTALAMIYADMFEGTVRRFNRLPEKNRSAFFQEVGTELKPAVPAQGYVAFGLASDDLGGTAAYSADALAAAGADAANAGSTMAMSAEELAAAAAAGVAAGVAAGAEVVATAAAEAAEPGDESAAYDETEAEVEEVAEADEGSVEADAEEAGDASDFGEFGDAFFTSELTGSEAAAAEVEPAATEGPEPAHVNAEGNYRYGADAIRALGMLPESCVLEYDEPEPPAPAEPAAPAAEPVAAELVAEADETVEPEVAGDDADYDGHAEDEAYDDYAEDDYDGAYAEDDAYDEGAHDETYDEDAYEGYDESGYAYQPSEYGSTGLSRLTGRGGIAEKLSGFGASASRFFGSVLDRGKSAIQNIEEAAHGVADRLSGSDEALDELAEDEAALDAAAGCRGC